MPRLVGRRLLRRRLLVGAVCLYLGILVICQLTSGQWGPHLVPGSDHLRHADHQTRAGHLVRRTLDLPEIRYQLYDYSASNPHHDRRENAAIGGARIPLGGSDNGQDLQTVNRRRNRRPNQVPPHDLMLNQPYLCHQVDSDDVTAPRPPSSQLPYMHVYLLIIVHSHPGNKRRRNAIRGTWGHVVHRNGDWGNTLQVVILFLLGMPRDYEEYQSVHKEGALYRDVVVFDFVDDYRNLTTKSLLGLYWATSYCSSAKYVLKADDDVYLNVPLFLNVLQHYPERDLILGSLNPRSPVKRYGQWEVAYGDYPYSHFPPYCSGCAYVISGDVVSHLYQMSQVGQSPPIIPVEDVYVTGLLAGQLGVTCRHHAQFPTWITVPTLKHATDYLQGHLLGLHGVDWIHMHALWEIVQKCANCSTDLQQARNWFSWFLKKDPMYR